MIEAITLSTPELGDRSYLVHDGRSAVVVDPQRDTDRIRSAAAGAGLRIACVAETHVHNDYVSGGWSLARELDVPHLVAGSERVCFERRAVGDGDEITIGPEFSIRVVGTPGHTPHHVSYVAMERGRPALVCTGGSLLFGSVGRTDLFGQGLAANLARDQYRSAQRLGELPGGVRVLPTHGFASLCSVGAVDVDRSDVAEQRAVNLAFTVATEAEFVEVLLASFGDYPRYYHRMAERNRKGARVPDLSPPPLLDLDQAVTVAATKSWVVDLRPRRSFADRHLDGTFNVEYGTSFTTHLGWLLPDDVPLVLLAERSETVAAAQVDLSRIGIDCVSGRYVGALPPPADRGPVRSYPVRGFDELAEAVSTPGSVALDVRRADEWSAGHLEQALHIPLHELEQRREEIPAGRIWVHCAAGYRAAIAASMLQRHGRDVVLVDGPMPTAS